MTGIGMTAAICAGIIWFLAWLDSPESRYQSYPDHYKMIYKHRGSVDLAAFGGSDLYTWLNPVMLSDLLAPEMGRKPVVYNLAKNWRGSDIKYVMLRDLLERKTVKNILVIWRWNGDDIHEHLYQVARFSDLFDSSFAKTNLPVWARLKEALNLSVRKIVWHVSLMIMGQRADLGALPETEAVSAGRTTAQWVMPSVILPQITEHCPKWETQPGRSWDIDAPIEAHNQHYYRKIADLARQKGVRAIFHEVPFVCRPPLSDAFARNVEDRYKVEMLLMSRQELKPFYPAGYSDHGHANPRGQAMYVKWLAQHLGIQRTSR